MHYFYHISGLQKVLDLSRDVLNKQMAKRSIRSEEEVLLIVRPTNERVITTDNNLWNSIKFSFGWGKVPPICTVTYANMVTSYFNMFCIKISITVVGQCARSQWSIWSYNRHGEPVV